jgi:hypothetical protein
MIELLFALGAAKVIGLSSVVGVSSGSGSVYVHVANGIFHNGGAAHRNLLGSLIRGDYGSAIELRPSAGHSLLALKHFVSLSSGSNRNHLTMEMN